MKIKQQQISIKEKFILYQFIQIEMKKKIQNHLMKKYKKMNQKLQKKKELKIK